MSVTLNIIEVFVSFASIFILFFSLNQIKLSFRTVLIALICRIPVAVVIAILNTLLSVQLFTYLDEPLYGFVLAIVFLRPLSKTLLTFYGLFSFMVWNLFYRCITYFVLPLFGQTIGEIQDVTTYILVTFSSLGLVFLFLKWLRYDFLQLRTDNLALENRRILFISNLVMIVYYVLMAFLLYLEYEKGLTTFEVRRMILVTNLIIFMGLIKQLDVYLRKQVQERLDFQQSLELRNLENYSKHVEELYQEVRGFRHDYTNLLTTLRLAIDDNDLNQVKDIYRSVLKDSHKRFRHQKYDIGRLVNIDNPALKSLLAAKFVQASEHNISVGLEVPDLIKPCGMALVDFITIISILCDNAIEASVETNRPKMAIAFLTVDNKQKFIIENSIKEESIQIADLYRLGFSSKGNNRGIGLNNVIKILEHYPHVSLNTTSQTYQFCQVLEIGLVE